MKLKPIRFIVLPVLFCFSFHQISFGFPTSQAPLFAISAYRVERIADSDNPSHVFAGLPADGSAAGGGLNTGTLQGAVSTLKSALPFLSMDLASSGLVSIGNALGLDPRITGLISIPVRASVAGLTQSLLNPNGGGGPGRILQTIKDSLLSKETLGGIVSVGTSIGLDSINAPSILQDFIPNILNQLTANGSGSTGGSGPPTQAGTSLFGNIQDTFSKFSGGIVSAAGNLVSFGAKVLEGFGGVTKTGFGKAVDLFSNIFNRSTIEKLISIGNGSIESAIQQFSNLTANGIEFIKDGVSIIWNSAADTFQYMDGAIQGTFNRLAIDPATSIFGGGVALAQTLTDGVLLDQEIGSNGQQTLAIKDTGGNIFLKILSTGAKTIFDSAGNFIDGIIEGINGTIQIVVESGKIVETTILNGIKTAVETLSNLAETAGGTLARALQSADETLSKLLIGKMDTDPWDNPRINQEVGACYAMNAQGYCEVREGEKVISRTVRFGDFLDDKPGARDAVRGIMSEEEYQRLSTEAVVKDFGAQMQNDEWFLTVSREGTIEKIDQFYKTAKSSVLGRRMLLTDDFNPLHKGILQVDAQGNPLKDQFGFEIRDPNIGVRIGRDGRHYHNKGTTFVLSHNDSNSNTSISSAVKHGFFDVFLEHLLGIKKEEQKQ